MKFAEFKKAGHWPTLLAAFLYFDISFMAWVALGPLMVYIAHDMNLATGHSRRDAYSFKADFLTRAFAHAPARLKQMSNNANSG